MGNKNFIPFFRLTPYWPNDAFPLDDIIQDLGELLDLDDGVPADPLRLINGILGAKNIRRYHYDGVTTYTGDGVLASQIVIPFPGNYIGLVLGEPDGEDLLAQTNISFSLTVSDNKSIRNSDFDPAFDLLQPIPQADGFKVLERETVDIADTFNPWELRLENIPAGIRLLDGLRVQAMEEVTERGRITGFRALEESRVQVGVNLSVTFDADKGISLDIRDMINFGYFRIKDSKVVIAAEDIAYHGKGELFPEGIQLPAEIDEEHEGFYAGNIGAYFFDETISPHQEFTAGTVTNLFIGKNVFNARFALHYNLPADSPFNANRPVRPPLPDFPIRLRTLDLTITHGPDEHLQVIGHAGLVFIAEYLGSMPLNVDLTIGHVIKALPDDDHKGRYLEFSGALSTNQNGALIHESDDRTFSIDYETFETSQLKMITELSRLFFGLSVPIEDLGLEPAPFIAEISTDIALHFQLGENHRDFSDFLSVGSKGIGLRVIFGEEFELIEGGLWLEISKVNLSMTLWGFEIEISRLRFGTSPHKFFIGADARVKLASGLFEGKLIGLVIGLKNDDRALLDVRGVGIAVETETFAMKGELEFLKDVAVANNPEMEIMPGSIRGEIAMAFKLWGNSFQFALGFMYGHYIIRGGSRDEKTFWAMSLDILKLPCPIVSTLGDLGFWGFSIMIGQNIAPKGPPAQSWYQWYVADPRYVITALNKWEPADGTFVFGLGISWGSIINEAYPYNGKLMGLIKSNPATFIADAKIKLFRPISHPATPEIAVLMIVSEGFFLLKATIDFRIPTYPNQIRGLLIALRGFIEIQVDRINDNTHLYLGKNRPFSERVTASNFYGLFTSGSFFMVDWQPLELERKTLPPVATGFGLMQEWSWSASLGPLGIYFDVGIMVEAGVTVSPFVFYAYGKVWGRAGIRVWRFRFGLSIDVDLLFFVSKTEWEVDGNIRIKLNLPWPLPDIKKTLHMHWGTEPSPPDALAAIAQGLAVGSYSRKASYLLWEWSEDGNHLDRPEEFEREKSELPVDGSLVLSLRKPVQSNVEWLEGVDPVPQDGSGDWKFRYVLEDILIERKLPGEANFTPLPDEYKKAAWDLMSSNTPANSINNTLEGRTPETKNIRIWPYELGADLNNLGNLERTGGINVLDTYFEVFDSWPCGPNIDDGPKCAHFDLRSVSHLNPPRKPKRLVVLEDGTRVWFNAVLNPFIPFFLNYTFLAYVSLDKVVPNPAQAEIPEYEHLLDMPYLYLNPVFFGQDLTDRPFPLLALLEVKIPPSVDVTLRLFSMNKPEAFLVRGFKGNEWIVNSDGESGEGLKEFNLTAPDQDHPINRLIIFSLILPSAQPKEERGISKLVDVCFKTLNQVIVEEHIEVTRGRLPGLPEIYQEPPGLAGDNADFYRLHPEGTEYKITPVVSAFKQKPDSNGAWEEDYNHVSLRTADVSVGKPPADLSSYIDSTSPEKEQSPVYLSEDIRIVFNKPYGPEMYTVSNYDLVPQVRDKNDNVMSLQSTVTQFSEEAALNPVDEMIIEQINNSPCLNGSLQNVRGKLEYVLRLNLHPKEKHTLAFRSSAYLGEDLYTVPFTTSRYQNINEQVTAIAANQFYELFPSNLNSDIIRNVLSFTPYVEREEENKYFESLWEHGLRLPSISKVPDEPEQTVYYFKDNDRAEVMPLAIVIASPEPLFVERRVTNNIRGAVRRDLTVVRDNDGMRTLIVKADAQHQLQPLPVGTIDIDLTYHQNISGLPLRSTGGVSNNINARLTIDVQRNPNLNIVAIS